MHDMDAATAVRDNTAREVGGDRRRWSLRGHWLVVVAIAVALLWAVVLFVIPEQPDWVPVLQALAPSESATRLDLVLGICDSSVLIPTPQVEETHSDVRITIDARMKHHGDTASCATNASVTLASQLGTRQVIDGHSGHPVEVIFTDPASPSSNG